MGLFSKKSIDKAKALAEKNAAKIAQGVDKATDAVDKKTGHKYSDKLQKVDQAARKFAVKAPSGDAGESAAGESGAAEGTSSGEPST